MKNKILSFAIVLCMLFGIMAMPVGAENTEGYFTYYVTPEKEAIIVSVNPQISGNVILPSQTNDGYRVIGIGERAFNGCNNIESLTIGSDVEEIDSTAFMLSSNIGSITVLPGNNYYSSEDGVLFDVNKTALISYPRGRSGSYVIPNHVTEIGDWAFYSCENLTSVENTDSVSVIGAEAFSYCTSLVSVRIPNGVAEIQGATFAGCFNLTSIEIPASVHYIGNFAFFECDKLTDVIYHGSEAEWNSIEIGGQGNDFLKNANIHCHGTPSNASTGGGGSEIWTDGVIVSENNLDIEDLGYMYIAGEDAYNPNSVGKVRLDFEVTDSVVNKAGRVRICSWWDSTIPSQQEITNSRELMISIWKQSTPLAIDTQTAPYRGGGTFPIHNDDLGKTLYVLLVGIDENCDWAGEALIKVDIPDNQGGTTPVEPEKIQQDIAVIMPQEAAYGDETVFINVFPKTATSGLYGFTFESSNPEVAEIIDGAAGFFINVKSAGETQITVKQAGDDVFAPFEYPQTFVVHPKEITISFIDLVSKTVWFDGILGADKDFVALDFDKLDKTFNEIVERTTTASPEPIKQAEFTVKNFILKGDKAKNYKVVTESLTAYSEISETTEENIETTEGVTAEICKTEDTMIISDIDISAFDAEEQEKIVFDTTKGNEKISAVSIIAGGIQAMAQAEVPFELALTDKNDKTATFEFDKDALSAISEGITGNISIKVETPDNTDLNDAQQVQTTALASKNPAVYSFNIENGNTDFGTGKATVKVYYDKTGTGDVTAVYLKEDGTTEEVTVVYDEETKTVILKLSHFSDYVIYTEPPHSSGGGGATSYTVKLNTNGGDELKDIKVKKGQAIGTIQKPQKKGFIFDGWYSDEELTKAYSADEKVTESTTLFAGWKVDPIRQMTLTIGNKSATVFGKETANDVAPIIRNDRTMLPIRFIAEALGARVDWDGETKTVTITSENIVIEITIDQGVAVVNGEEIELDSPAFIESDRTFLPLRFVSENLGAEVDWVEESRQVVITKPVEEE